MDEELVGRAWMIAVLALGLAGCGGSGAGVSSEGAAAGKPEATSGSAAEVRAVRADLAVPGATVPPRIGDLALRAFGPTPVGPISADEARRYPLHVQLRNTSDHPISLDSLWMHASVYRNGLLYLDCGEVAPQRVQGVPDALPAQSAVLIAQALPCDLTEPGDYEVVSVAMIGEPDSVIDVEPALQDQISVSMPLTIDGSLPPFRAVGAAEPGEAPATSR